MRKKYKREGTKRSAVFKRGAVHDRKIKKNLSKRKCLSCEEEFNSEGIHNRICPLCKGTEEWEMGNDYSVMQQ
jgi:Zn finger protein HypA/HybF involved in hydrogenase expression